MSFDAYVQSAQLSFHEQTLARPLILSSGAITQLTEARVRVAVTINGRTATGHGSIYLSDLWAWPEPTLSHAHRDQALRRFTQTIADRLPELTGEPAHPLELGMRLHNRICLETPDGPPVLAQAMCLSPFDAAIHDAAGRALGRSAFGFYDTAAPIASADQFFGSTGAVAAIASMLRSPRLDALPGWYVVGRDDDFERDVKSWIIDRGYRCLKIKTLGKDCADDVARTVEAYRAVKGWGVDPVLSVDSNEAHCDAQGVLEYLHRLKEADADAFAALRYMEQPTGRDIQRYRYDWRAVTALKPVLLDEGLTSLGLLEESRRQGWSGLALKTCKGHSFALLAAAWAHQHGMLLAMQDLTNPGYALMHAALFAAYVPTINGVELNSPQFTPSANAAWLPPHGHLQRLFSPRDGKHRLPPGPETGLGSEYAIHGA